MIQERLIFIQFVHTFSIVQNVCPSGCISTWNNRMRMGFIHTFYNLVVKRAARSTRILLPRSGIFLQLHLYGSLLFLHHRMRRHKERFGCVMQAALANCTRRLNVRKMDDAKWRIAKEWPTEQCWWRTEDKQAHTPLTMLHGRTGGGWWLSGENYNKSAKIEPPLSNLNVEYWLFFFANLPMTNKSRISNVK